MPRAPLASLLILALGCGGRALAGDRLSPEQAQALLRTPGVLLLDVRTEAEHRDQHIPGTGALIPVQDLAARLKELDRARKGPILVYCRSGHRSQAAMELLEKSGFRNVSDLEGGIQRWAAQGLPTASGAFVPPRE